MRARTVNEEKFERGQDPKRTMGIGIQPFVWDELYDMWEDSDFKRLVDPDNTWGDTEIDSFFYPYGDEDWEDTFTKFEASGIIDHPMSGYGGSYNQADVDLTVEKLPDGKIHIYGTKVMEIGKIRRGEDGDYDGERYGGKKGKPKKVDFTIDSVDDLFDALEEVPQ